MYCGSKKSVSKVAAGVAGVLMLTTSAIAFAATGPSGQSATSTVSISIPERVSIFDLDDISFNNWDFAGDEQGTDNLCVWSNDGANGDYQVTITSDTGSFVLQNGGPTEIDFTVEWATLANQTSGTSISEGVPAAFSLSSPTTPTCQGGTSPNTTLIVDITESELAAQATSATVYDAVLTVLIEVQP